MGEIEAPMLAATLVEMKDVKYPAFCTPKLDGIRCLVVDGQAVTRNFKPFPNRHVNRMVSVLPDGFDGEIVCGKKKFNEVSHLVMAHDGEPDFQYVVFDYVKGTGSADEAYEDRMKRLAEEPAPSWVKKLIPIRIENEQELLEFEVKCLAEGYEGVMLRTGTSPYKFGRSTVREGYLVKLKRFTDSEAVITDLVEQMENTNAKVDGERTSHQAGMIPKGVLGAFTVKDVKSGVVFSIGSGMDNELRNEVWKHKKNYIGKIIKYNSQKHGEKDAPRFPVFLGFRDAADM